MFPESDSVRWEDAVLFLTREFVLLFPIGHP